MSTIFIEKYVDGMQQEMISVPVGPVRFLAGFLPGRAKLELSRRGLDLDALLDERAVEPAVQWMDVHEGEVAKKIRISRR